MGEASASCARACEIDRMPVALKLCHPPRPECFAEYLQLLDKLPTPSITGKIWYELQTSETTQGGQPWVYFYRPSEANVVRTGQTRWLCCPLAAIALFLAALATLATCLHSSSPLSLLPPCSCPFPPLKALPSRPCPQGPALGNVPALLACSRRPLPDLQATPAPLMHAAFAAFLRRAATAGLKAESCRIMSKLMADMSRSYQDTTSEARTAMLCLDSQFIDAPRGGEGERARIFRGQLQELLQVHLPGEKAVLQPAAVALVSCAQLLRRGTAWWLLRCCLRVLLHVLCDRAPGPRQMAAGASMMQAMGLWLMP